MRALDKRLVIRVMLLTLAAPEGLAEVADRDQAGAKAQIPTPGDTVRQATGQ